MKKTQLTKEQFKQLIREMIIQEFSKADDKIRQQQAKLINIPGTFSHWMQKMGKVISATGGKLDKLLTLLHTARKKGEISHMSNNTFDKLIANLKSAPNDMKRLYCMYNYDLKGRGLGSFK